MPNELGWTTRSATERSSLARSSPTASRNFQPCSEMPSAARTSSSSRRDTTAKPRSCYRHANRLTKGRALVSDVDLLRVTTLGDFASELATALYNGIVAPVDRLKRRAGELFAALPTRPK